MSEWRISTRAGVDLAAIYLHTFKKFGESQAEAYTEGLKRTFGLIADFPGIGTSADEIKTGHRRFRFQSHYIFYTQEHGHVLIRALIHVRRSLRGELFD
jgi:toxin ParE1/3/4